MSNDVKITKEEKQLLKELFYSSFVLEASYNYERQQSLGYAIGIWPAIKRYYHTKEEQAEALERHLAIFNITPHLAPTVTGVAVALEKKASEDETFDKNTINSIKVGLMGPLSGIGDSIFWGTLRVIAAGIGISLAQEGSILGPILFLIIFNIPHLLIRWYGLLFGYKFGTNLISSVSESGIIAKLSKGATIVGLTVIGAMSASMVRMKSTLGFTLGDVSFDLQTYLDKIFPLMLPLAYTLFMFYLLKKGKKSTTLLLVSIATGILGALLGIL